MTGGRLKRVLAWTSLLVVQFAALLNFCVAIGHARQGRWTISLLYLVIALTFTGVTLLAWHIQTRQRPYRWRGEGEPRAEDRH